ncbi:MAG: DMT family transporter [Ruminococcus sp.]|nr:DMT family transporter [Ruminococcus sp.]
MKVYSKYKGIIMIIISAFCFALMNMFVRLSGDLPTAEKAFFRNFVAFIFALVIMIKNRESFHFQKRNLPLLIGRSLAGTLGILGNFYAVSNMKVLGDASILNKMSPFFAVLFSLIFLRERLKVTQVLILTGAFIGAMFVVKPSFTNADLFASLCGFGGGIAAGAAYAMVRALGKRGENGAFIVLFFSGFSCLALLPLIIVNFKMFSVYQLCILLLAGLSAAGGQFAITAAYTYAPAREISIYDYSQIIFASALGFFAFGDIPDLYSVAGYLIIVVMALVMFLYNNNILKKANES